MTVDSILVLAKKLLDVILVWVLLYYILKSLRKNVKMILLFKGILVIVVVKIISDLLDLVTIGYLIDYVIEWAPLALIVIFQPEIRDALETLGRARFLGHHKTLSTTEKEKAVSEIINSLKFMQNNRIGALIVVERDISLANYINKAQKIYAQISSALLSSIFYTDNPLHDGGVIVQGDQIACASAVFPTSSSVAISKRLGTRHRAALGIAEQTDAIAVVLSEETGRISIAEEGELTYNLSIDEVRIRLLDGLTVKKSVKKGGDTDAQD